MAKHRSPNCPQIPFIDAVEQGRKVYEKEHTHPAAKEVVAQDLGYKGISGPSLAMIGALRQYGILEGSGTALKITKDALAYYEMDDGSEKTEAIQRMIFSPTLFGELRELFGSKLPSEGNLRHTLITRGFLPKAAEDVIEVYRANMELVSGEENVYSGDDKEIPVPTPNTFPTPLATSSTPKAIPAGVQTYAFALSPDARAELTLKGTISSDDLELLRDHIELTIKALARKAKSGVVEQ